MSEYLYYEFAAIDRYAFLVESSDTYCFSTGCWMKVKTKTDMRGMTAAAGCGVWFPCAMNCCEAICGDLSELAGRCGPVVGVSAAYCRQRRWVPPFSRR